MEKEVIIPNHNFNGKDYQYFILVADIGGSNSYIAVMGVKSKRDFEIIFKHTHKTSEMENLPHIINHALFEAKELYDIEINRCCIGAAGPVSRRRSYIKLSHTKMIINAKELLNDTLLNKIILVNDFEAVGFGVDLLDKDKDLERVPALGEDKTKEWIPGNTFAVMGAGFGLGMTILHYDFSKHVHVPLPSEGGHIDIAAKDDFEWEFLQYLKQNTQHDPDSQPEYENILSGKGMENIYNFLRSKGWGNDSELISQIDKMDCIDKLRSIESNYDNDDTCRKVIDILILFFGRCARNLALMSESYSGLLISGRITLNNIERFKDGKFMSEFLNSDKKSDVLSKIPVYIIKKSDIGLYGCCNVAVNFYNIC